jgi:hypothetical protein
MMAALTAIELLQGFHRSMYGSIQVVVVVCDI